LARQRDPEPPDPRNAHPCTGRSAHWAFTRTIVLPFRVDADKVSATLRSRVLTLELLGPRRTSRIT